MDRQKASRLLQLLNIFDIFGICLVLAIAMFYQIVYKQLPCPLCLLQRLGILAIAFGFLLNIHYHIRPQHYALCLLAALFTCFVSLRQVALHILPGNPGYGDVVFGLHMYTWVFLLGVATILYCSLMLSIPNQYEISQLTKQRTGVVKYLGHLAYLCLVAILLLNIVSTYAMCGLKECPEDPVEYQLFKS